MSLTYKKIKKSLFSLKRVIYKYPRLSIGILCSGIVFVTALWFLSTYIFNARVSEYQAEAYRKAFSDSLLESEIVFGRGNGDQQFKEFFLEKIQAAQESISIAMYSIEDPEIISLLQKKKDEGVQVTLVVPLRKERQHSIVFALTDLELIQVGRASGLSDEEYQEEPTGFMHHKFILIDEKTPNEQLILSSSNMTKSQFLYDPGFALVTSDQDIIQSFSDEFSQIKKAHTSLKKMRSGEYQPFALQKEYQDGFFKLWFSPGYLENSVRSSMLEYIEQAQESIKVIGWVITDKQIWEALVKKSQEGVKVSIIIDDHFLWDGSSSIDIEAAQKLPNLSIASDSYQNLVLEEKGLLGVKVSDNFNSFIHHHTLLIDDTYLFMGTNNWSRGGFYLNDESTVFTSIPSLVTEYVTEWNRLNKELAGETFTAEYDTTQNSVISKNLSEQATTIIAYREESDPLWLGQKCGEFPVRQKISLGADCVTTRTRIFALDKNKQLVASTYLHIK